MNHAWVIWREWGDKMVAHKAVDGATGCYFIPIFHRRRDAIAYSDERFAKGAVKITRVGITTGTGKGRP